jgi:hypothetical protein
MGSLQWQHIRECMQIMNMLEVASVPVQTLKQNVHVNARYSRRNSIFHLLGGATAV